MGVQETFQLSATAGHTRQTGVVLPRKDGSCVRLLGLKAGECRVTLSAPDARPVTVTVVVTDTDVVSRE